MRNKTFSYRGFHVMLHFDGEASFAQIMSPNEDAGVRFAPKWAVQPSTAQEAEQWLRAYTAGLIDCELAGGFGILLNRDAPSTQDFALTSTSGPAQ
ncbi:hypothetical protein [Cupriavidus pauculus]|uniref:hypothetical protein n=1 Tax=Cupriavidus pauculus TaxID=82633 RepID=UPI0007816902|nr:hypothetical protein [Cupriavidus pauculus]